MWPAKFTQKQQFTAICLLLALGTFILYWPITHNGFTNIDDGGYIAENSHVNSGLTWANISWAFEHPNLGYWIPLTWISHMIDCQLFGLNPAGHHLTNSLFHTANAVLLFLLLNNLTNAPWRSAFAAALFAWHPLRVESVAWAAERKDVLSGFFFLLTLLAYARYANLSKVQSPKSKIAYLLALIFFACGLMSKPMIVTLPCVLLLLDFWPLQRFTIGDWQFAIWRLISEKIPFFALSLAAGVATLAFEKAVIWSSQPLSWRITNAAVFAPSTKRLIRSSRKLPRENLLSRESNSATRFYTARVICVMAISSQNPPLFAIPRMRPFMACVRIEPRTPDVRGLLGHRKIGLCFWYRN